MVPSTAFSVHNSQITPTPTPRQHNKVNKTLLDKGVTNHKLEDVTGAEANISHGDGAVINLDVIAVTLDAHY
jgi:hypothetical protein